MVWFQCEDCGDQLKKPKLINHFRQCSAYRFSCIDCGEVFDQGRVQSHTQCITEAEKYGPKGQAKPFNAKQNKDQKQQQKPDFDINVGLSNRPPWFCSFCNTKATSKQALLIHAEGKKHRAKAKAFHLSQQPKVAEGFNPEIKNQTEGNGHSELPKDNGTKEMKVQDAPNGDTKDNGVELENGSAVSKKRKADTEMEAKTSEASGDEVEQGEEAEDGERKVKKAKNNEHDEDKKEDIKSEIKWKKLITSALKTNSDGVLKKKKLRKVVMNSLKESGITRDEDQLNEILEHKITSSSRFSVDKKYVRLVSKN